MTDTTQKDQPAKPKGIVAHLDKLKAELEALSESYGNVGQHLTNAAASIEEALSNLGELDDDDDAPQSRVTGI